ncbi:unnamed protein product, partial [Musa textilis]
MVFFFLALTLFLYLGVEFPRASPLPSPPPNRASILVDLILHHRSLHRLPLFLLAKCLWTKFGVALARSAVELQERQQSVRLASYWHGLPWCRIERSGKTCTQDQRVSLHQCCYWWLSTRGMSRDICENGPHKSRFPSVFNKKKKK